MFLVAALSKPVELIMLAIHLTYLRGFFLIIF
jgi:hypothetical protein